MRNLSGECVFMVVLLTLGCTSTRQWSDPNITQRILSTDAVKQYAGTKAVIRVTFTNKKNEEQSEEGSLLPADSDSPDILMIRIGQSTNQGRVLVIPIAQIKGIVLLTLQPSDFTDGEFNSFAQDKTARVVFKNHMVANVKNIMLAGDSLSWNEGLLQKRVHSSEINYVSFTNRTLGALEGFGMGLLLGELVGYSEYSGAKGGPGDNASLAGLALIVYPAIFGPIGLVGGAIVGSDTKYSFADK